MTMQDFKYVVADDVLPDGTFVPKGSTVTYSIYSIGRMKTIWGQDCLEFRPERWLTAEGDRFETPNDSYKFVAFNAGPRTCLGKDLAYLQMKSVASAVLLRYRLSPVPGHRVEQKMSLSLFMKNGLHVYLQPRGEVVSAWLILRICLSLENMFVIWSLNCCKQPTFRLFYSTIRYVL